MTETKPNKVLLPPFYAYEETLYPWILYKLKEFKWEQGLVIKLIKGSYDHHEDHKLFLFLKKNKSFKKPGTAIITTLTKPHKIWILD